MFSRPIPPLRKVGNGQILSFDLINSIIGRTEYAADLLQKNRLIAGSNVSLSQNANGTIISSSLVSEIITPQPQPTETSLVGYYGYDGLEAIPFIYQNGVYTTLVNPFPTINNQTYPYSIRNGIIVGFFYWGGNDTYSDYSTSFYIKNNNWTYFRHPDTGPPIQPVNTEAYGTDGQNIVGFLKPVFIDSSPVWPGFLYNIENESFQIFYNENTIVGPYTTRAYDIYSNKIVGQNDFNTSPTSRAFIYENNNFSNFIIENKPSFATGIYENKIVGWVQQPANINYNGFIYENGNYQIIAHPDSSNLNTLPFKIFQDKICGYYNDATDGNKIKGFVYDGSNWQTIMYPGSEYTVVYGIG